MKRKTLQEQAREQGVSVATIKRKLKERRDSDNLKIAESRLMKRTAGWNSRAGNRRKVK